MFGLCIGTWAVENGGASGQFAGSAVDLGFSTGEYFGGTLSSVTSLARTSPGYARTKAGVWTPFTSGSPRITDKGYLIEESRINLLPNSGMGGSGSYWFPQQGTSNGGVATGPDGIAASAGSFIEDTSNNTHENFAQFSKAASSLTYVGQFFAKASGRTRLFVRWFDSLNNGVQASVDLAAANWGAFSPTTSGSGFTVISSGISAETNGWVRVWCVFSTSTDTVLQFLPFLDNGSGTAGLSISYQGDGASGALFWGCDIQAGQNVTSPILTTAGSATRAADNVEIIDPYLTAILTAQTDISIFLELEEPPNYVGQETAPLFFGSGSTSFVACLFLNNSGSIEPLLKAAWNGLASHVDLFTVANIPYSPATEPGRIWRLIGNFGADGTFTEAATMDIAVNNGAVGGSPPGSITGTIPLTAAGSFCSIGSEIGVADWVNTYIRRIGWGFSPFQSAQMLSFVGATPAS